MPFVTADDACAYFGVTSRSLRRMVEKGELKTQKTESGRVFYDIPVPAEDKPYFFDGGKYVFTVPGRKRPVAVDKAWVDSLVDNWTNNVPMATIAERLKTPQGMLRSMLRDLGKNRDSAPFTDEDLLARNVDDLVSDLTRKKELEVVQKAERLEWKKIRAKAEQYANVEQIVESAVSRRERTEITVRRIADVTPGLPSSALVLMTQDFHYGALTPCGTSQEDRVIDLIERATSLVSDAVRVAKLERVFLQAGGDWFHTDNMSNTTTRGTPQDVILTNPMLWRGGTDAFIAYVEAVRAIMPKGCIIEVVQCAGNHDKLSSYALHRVLQSEYKNVLEVYVNPDLAPRVYVDYRKTAMCFTHGDAPKKERSMVLHHTEHPGEYVARLLISGHLHHAVHIEKDGVEYLQAPTPALHDWYHTREGWTDALRRMAGYLIGDRGLKNTTFA